MFFFAFTTILAYYYIAETNVSYIIPSDKQKIWIILVRLVLIGATIYGCVKTADVAWAMGDLGVGMMAWLNIIAIWILHKPALRALRDFEIQKKQKGSGYYAIYKPGPDEVPTAKFWHEDYPKRLKEFNLDDK